MPEDLKSLVKNPLGIVALFIALIYGFAALLLGFSAEQLQPEERQPLIWFIVLFPIIVLGSFYVLVTRHHGKLYAPKDYQSDDSFLKTLTPKQQERRLEEEIDSDELVQINATESTVQLPENEVAKDVSFSVSRNDKVAPSSESTDVSIDTLRYIYKKAENLAIREIEIDYGLKFRRQVSFGVDATTAFDGVSINGDLITAVEVKYLRIALISASFIRELLLRGKLASNFIGEGKSFKLIIVIVLESLTDSTERIERQIKRYAGDAGFDVDIRFYRYHELYNKAHS